MLAALAFLLTISDVYAVTPAGTAINNTAQVTYSVGGTGGQVILSNTHQFVVEANLPTDSVATQTDYTPASAQLYAGEALQFTVTLTNSGANTLSNGELHLHGPSGSGLQVDNVLVMKPRAAADASTLVYPVPDLASGAQLAITGTLDLPVGMSAGSHPLAIEYHANGQTFPVQQIDITVLDRTDGDLQLLQYSPGGGAPLSIMPTEYDAGGGNFLVLAVPLLPDTVIFVTAQPVPLEVATEFSHGQTIFVRLADQDQNHDPAVADDVVVTLSVIGSTEQEALRLRETGVDTGVFTGYATLAVGAAVSNNGILEVGTNALLSAEYTDTVDTNDHVDSIVLIDPYGRIFDSTTGAMLDGFIVSLVKAADGQPATVYGDDGVSLYPATVTSGGSVADSNGNTYTFAAGSYRFPFVEPGDYRLVITPPAGSPYRGPSARTDAQLAGVPGGPFAADIGSRGETFTVRAGPPLRLDIPMDPLASALYVQRSAGKERVSAGDFIAFQVIVENTSVAGLTDVIVNDTLPHGFRYRAGSLRINGAAGAEPTIAGDGTALAFALGDLAANTTATLSYVAEVGAVNPGQVTSRSRATANSGAVSSNVSQLQTTVGEDLLRSRDVLMGAVLLRNPEGGGNPVGLAGVRIYMEDGTYAVTDATGRFHFEGIKPGTHVVQLDLDTLAPQYEVIPFEQNTRFAGRAWSKFVDLQGGTLWRVDFHVALKPKQQGGVTLELAGRPLEDGSSVEYRIALAGSTVPLRNPHLMLMLPEGTRYESSRDALDAGLQPPVVEENVLSFRLPDTIGDWRRDLYIKVSLDTKREPSELIAKAMLSFDTPQAQRQRTPIAEHRLTQRIEESNRVTQDFILRPTFGKLEADLADNDREGMERLIERLAGLQNLRIVAIGHTDNQKVRSRSRRIYADNQALSEARALTVARYLMERLKLTPAQVTAVGRGDAEPITDNKTAEGRAQNRRVELRIQGEQVEFKTTVQAPDQPPVKLEVPTQGLRPGEAWPVSKAAAAVVAATAPIYDEAWLKRTAPGFEWLSPADGALPPIASIDIAVKHDPSHKIKVLLNGAPVADVNFDRTLRNGELVALSRWTGVDLKEGENRLDVVVENGKGVALRRLTRKVHAARPPVHAEPVEASSQLIADGITPPVIALRLLDRDNRPARKGVIGEYKIEPPYRPEAKQKLEIGNLKGAPQERPTYTVGDDGLVLIRLQPTSETGEVRIELPLAGGKVERVKATLKPKAREWILVGLAEGTAGYNVLGGHKETLTGKAAEDHIYRDGRVAFFAKGRVLGKWVLTAAYDSAKQKPAAKPGLYQTIDPGTYYTLYADSSSQQYDAASSKKLYLKLERDEFYALYGDYETGLTDTNLAQYSRNLTGLKSRYRDTTMDVVIFNSESLQAFVRDDIRGQGITGPYKLSRGNIVLNSEQVAVEVRDRFRSDQIVKHTVLARHIDYDIDYDKGTLTFREPVFSTDGALNPSFIVVKFESFDGRDRELTYGGRVAKAVGKKLTVGATHVKEGRTGGKAELSGVDLRYQAGRNTQIKVETAHTESRDNSGQGDGDAFLVEVDRRGEKWDGKAYFSQQGKGFGIGQLSGADAATRKSGVQANLRPTEKLAINTQAYREENLATQATRDLVEAQSRMQLDDQTEIRVGLRAVHDDLGDGSRQDSNQITAGATRSLLGGKVQLRADHEQALGAAESVDFPTRTKLGADYRVTDKTTLFAEEELADGAERDTRNTRLGLRTTPWEGGEVASTVTQTNGAEDTTSAGVSLRQRLKLNETWSLDVGGEESRTLSRSGGTPLNTNVPFSGGTTDDFTAGSLGLTYDPGTWLWTARMEARNAQSQDTWSVATSAQTQPGKDLALLTSFAFLNTETSGGETQDSASAHLGIAYHPLLSRWLILNRLDLVHERRSGVDLPYRSRRLVNNLNTNYRPNGRAQLAFQYGAKYALETIDGADYRGYTDLLGIEGRYDVTKDWDVGLQTSVLHSWKLRQYDYSLGASVGHNFAENVWVSVGYNFFGFYDRDFSLSRYTSRGFFLRLRLKFDQQSVKEAVKEAVKWAGQ